MAELVGQHHAHDRRPEVLGQRAEQAVVAIVVDHEVAERAVERDELRNVLVRRVRLAAPRDVVTFRIGGVDAARQLLELLAVDLRVGGTPERLDVTQGGGDELVVGTRLLVVPDIDDVGDVVGGVDHLFQRRRRRRSDRWTVGPVSSVVFSVASVVSVGVGGVG